MREASSRLAQRALLGDFVNVVSIRFAECPHPTLRTTRYSVFKDRSRSWELVESAIQTVELEPKTQSRRSPAPLDWRREIRSMAWDPPCE